MRRAEGLELPAFFNYYDTPVKVVGTPDGGMLAWKLVRETGGWQSADRLIDKILLVGGDGVEALSRSEFIELTEYERGVISGEVARSSHSMKPSALLPTHWPESGGIRLPRRQP